MITSFRRLYSFISWCLLLFFIGYHPLNAQSSIPQKKWNFLTDLYLMFPNIDGETGIGESLIIPVDASPGDVFSHLQMGEEPQEFIFDVNEFDPEVRFGFNL
jgi:hypothetical protein